MASASTMNTRIISIVNSKIFRYMVFWVVILGLSYIYNYHETIQYRPTSMHQWRNSVSASIALNYAHEGEFFHPRTHNMQVDDFTSDITITEFPIIYYAVGMLYRLFGFHEWIFKLIQILIGYAGLFCLFRLGLRTFKNLIYALFLPILIFTSPIFIYYLNNFIPDATSLALAIIGFYYFSTFYRKRQHRHFLISMLVFGLAGLIKTPAMLLFFAISGIYMLEWLFNMQFKSEGRIFFKPVRHVAIAFGVFMLVVAWYLYAKIYTDIHGGVVSLVEIRPIWILSKETIQITMDKVQMRFWRGQYHSPVLLIFTLVLLIHNIISWKKHNKLYSWLIILTLIGGIIFSLLFFRSLRNHDYYQLNNLIVPLLIMFNFMIFLSDHYAKIFNSWITKVVFALFALYLTYNAQKLINNHYYNGWHENYARTHYNKLYNDITPELRSLGIDRYDKVYCTPDNSINISLYLMDQK